MVTFPAVLSQADTSQAPLGSVGAKAATLARMAREGIPVPPFYVVPSAAFALHLSHNRIAWPPSAARLADPGASSTLRERIRASPMEAALAHRILEAHGHLCAPGGHARVAVRSSGSEEDSAPASFAGQFSSFLNLGEPALLDAVKDCWASSVSDRSLQYRAANRMPLGPSPAFGVIVQTQVLSERAGVVFTVHPLEPDRGLLYIEANFGSGESVVGGLTTPDSATLSRPDGQVVERVTATKRRMSAVSARRPGSHLVEVEAAQRNAPVLADCEVQELFRMGLRIEQLMGSPQDIEWAYDPHRLWILQARPITGLRSNII